MYCCYNRHRPLLPLLLIALLFAAAAGYCRFLYAPPPEPPVTMAESPHEVHDTPIAEYRPAIPPSPAAQRIRTAAPEPEISAEPSAVPPAQPASMENCLLIGDSRTVGLREYAELQGAEFFASTGLGPHKIKDARLSVPGVGKVSLNELLIARRYDRIYVTLGINEIGYPAGTLIEKYRALIGSIRAAQPEALIILQGNLHVTQAWSDQDPVINNPALDAFNADTAALADGKTVFYLDPNLLFDDPCGSLSAEKCSDGAHLRAKYYIEWGEWLALQTGEILRSLQGADAK